MKEKLAKLLKRIEELAFKADLSAEEAKELQVAMIEKQKLETQIEAQEASTAARTAELDAAVAERVAAQTAELQATHEAEITRLNDEHAAAIVAAGVRNAPLTQGSGGENRALQIKVSSPYDRLGDFDLCMRYEMLKSYGHQPSLEMWRALAERAVKLSQTEDIVRMENGREVKASAIDWSYMDPGQMKYWKPEDDDDSKLFGVKADVRDGGEDPVSLRGYRQLHQIAVKANELIYSTQGSYGDEWVPTLWNNILWRTIRLNAAVLPLFDSFDMPSQPYEYPAESSDPTFYLVGETTAESQLVIDAGPYFDSKMGTRKVTFTALKMGALSYWSEEMEEDSIIAAEPQFRDQYSLTFAHTLDYILINGDKTTGATTNINYEGTSPSGSERYLVLDGLRHEPMVTTTTDKRDGATLTIDDFAATQALMGTAGKYGVNPNDLVFIADTGVYHKAKVLGEVLTVDKFGPMATVLTGQLAAVFGVPLIVSEDYPLTDATGHIDDTAGDNVKGSFLCVNKRGFKLGWKRRPRVRVFGFPGADARAIIASCRLAFMPMTAGMAALSYNVTV